MISLLPNSLPPGCLILIGALFVPLLQGWGRSVYMLALPLVSFLHLYALPHGEYGQLVLFDYTLTLIRIDALSFAFGTIFHIAAFLGGIYAVHVKDPVQHVAGLVYVGSAIGAVFAGDLISLFVYWELTAVSSVFLIWARRTERSYQAGMRYLLVQVSSGLLLLAGAIFHIQDTGDPDVWIFGTWQYWHESHFCGLWHQMRVPFAPQLATGCLPRSHRERHGFSECVYHQACRLHLSPWLSRHRHADLDWGADGRLSHFLCGD